ncbi:hypothetical protein BXZ70DRAFT_324904 [Cristinia sonorae]|uniref:Uncharacterized protein n=1 Tax=Cristinia sonorae TaxID=1940300 RepID=A0A8K0ULC0_9AGAR|nr:hypothetical protein BXZ70DRAFT_324904 [Cristinia sonorae]
MALHTSRRPPPIPNQGSPCVTPSSSRMRLSDASTSSYSSSGMDYWSDDYSPRYSSSSMTSMTSTSRVSFGPRPLPSVPPTTPDDASYKHDSTASQTLRRTPKRSDSLRALKSSPQGPRPQNRRPQISLLVDFLSVPPTEVVLESPLTPPSPITFTENDDDYRKARETKLAVRLSAFGFVEVPSTTPLSHRCNDVVELVEHDDSDDYLSPVSPSTKRYSRRWVRETKGKRFEVEDYKKVLETLRKL